MDSEGHSEQSAKFITPHNEQFYAAGQYRPLNPENHEIRLLEILPGTQDSLLHCKLLHPPHSTVRPYACISYRAGSADNVSKIVINEVPFNAFATLSAALYKLRHPDESRVVWADQICINQSDVVERGSQVQQMTSIYAGADKVYAWLGHIVHSDAIYEELMRVKSAFDDACKVHCETHERLMPVDRLVIFERLAYSMRDRYDDRENDHLVLGMEEMFGSEFWGRLWIMQEVIVAKQVLLASNSGFIDIVDFYLLADILSELLDKLDRTGLLIPTNPSSLVRKLYGGFGRHITTIATFKAGQRDWKKNKVLDCKHLLMRGRSKRCSDPRDRVFAFRGLIADRYAIDVNYTLSIQSVYINCNIAIIQAEQSLDVLAYCRHPRNLDARLGLPTWCVDWSTALTRDNRRQLLLWDSVDHFSCKFRAFKGVSGRCYFSAGPLQDGLFTYVSLHTEAIILGSIQSVGESGREGSDAPKKTFEQLIESWLELIVRYHPLKPRESKDVEKTATVDDRGYPNVSSPRNNIDASNYGRLKADVVEANRRFVLTDFDCIGMAPPHVQIGDTVCVLIGSRVPFLLRKKGTFFTLVGEMYLSDGYMDGKVVDKLTAGQVRKTLVEIR